MMPIIQLGPEHLPAVIALHHKVLKLLPANLAAHESDMFFADHMANCGHIYGVFQRGELMVYSVLGLPRPNDPNFGCDHNLSAQELADVAHIDGVAVTPALRGQGWQRKMIDHRLAAALAAGRPIALSTVAPGNLASLRSLLSCGLTIRGIAEKFGGVRYLVRRDLLAGAISRPAISDYETTSGVWWIDLVDLATQSTVLSRGYIGAGWRVRGGEIQIGYIAE